jgi:hypothetical protein
MQAFQLLHSECQHERQELAAAAEPALQVLRQRKQRQVLWAWLAAVRQQQRQHALVSNLTDTGGAYLLCCAAVVRRLATMVDGMMNQPALL